MTKLIIITPELSKASARSMAFRHISHGNTPVTASDHFEVHFVSTPEQLANVELNATSIPYVYLSSSKTIPVNTVKLMIEFATRVEKIPGSVQVFEMLS